VPLAFSRLKSPLQDFLGKSRLQIVFPQKDTYGRSGIGSPRTRRYFPQRAGLIFKRLMNRINTNMPKSIPVLPCVFEEGVKVCVVMSTVFQ
jgi:hypothetical protein